MTAPSEMATATGMAPLSGGVRGFTAGRLSAALVNRAAAVTPATAVSRVRRVMAFSPSFRAQSILGVDTRGAAGGHVGGQQSGAEQDGRYQRVGGRVGRLNFEEQRFQTAGQLDGAGQSDGQADDYQEHSLAHHEAHDIPGGSAQRHADADLTGTLSHGEGQHGADAGDGDDQGQDGEESK